MTSCPLHNLSWRSRVLPPREDLGLEFRLYTSLGTIEDVRRTSSSVDPRGFSHGRTGTSVLRNVSCRPAPGFNLPRSSLTAGLQLRLPHKIPTPGENSPGVGFQRLDGARRMTASNAVRVYFAAWQHAAPASQQGLPGKQHSVPSTQQAFCEVLHAPPASQQGLPGKQQSAPSTQQAFCEVQQAPPNKRLLELGEACELTP